MERRGRFIGLQWITLPMLNQSSNASYRRSGMGHVSGMGHEVRLWLCFIVFVEFGFRILVVGDVNDIVFV